MKTNKLKLTTTFLVLLISFTVFSQGPPRGGQGRGGDRQGGGQQRGGRPDASEILKMLDTDDDNKISKEEASKDRRGKISEDFDEIDVNEDGFIDLDELKASLENRRPKKVSAKKVLKEVDQNEDGKLNELEVSAKDRRELIDNFTKIDTNDDGELDIDELKAFYSKNTGKNKRRRQRDN
ncbi:EF-hand domain-containing protein [uncultured Winogradskyella sp.]|uniref:EF-hand domain-containing protein n=1 Tax=uncultured Winogradskyella sp. TaxID=395353 RepID=UPI00260E9B57|nr:EF-hand domain-containing protein [uncultured Winogradskyella sp.]